RQTMPDDQLFQPRAVEARARRFVADDEEFDAARELFRKKRCGAHEILLILDLAQLADDADAKQPLRRPPFRLFALEGRTRLLEAAQVNSVRDDANPFRAGDFLRAQ